MKANPTSSPPPAPPGSGGTAPTGRLLIWLFVLVWLGVLMLVLPLTGRAQLVANYTLATSTGTFTELTGATLVPGLRVDTGNTPAIPLGFPFQFEGVNYTSVIATSDGYLSFNPALNNSTYGNGLAFVTPTSDPLIAGLWDDLTGGVTGSQASYAVTGAPGARVFTFEWLRWGWNYNATAGSISFQIRLREGSNQVELIYRPEAATPVSPSASVGLRAAGGQGPGSFLSINSLGLSATASSTTATDNIAAKPTVSGLTLTLTPPACTSRPPTPRCPLAKASRRPGPMPAPPATRPEPAGAPPRSSATTRGGATTTARPPSGAIRPRICPRRSPARAAGRPFSTAPTPTRAAPATSICTWTSAPAAPKRCRSTT